MQVQLREPLSLRLALPRAARGERQLMGIDAQMFARTRVVRTPVEVRKLSVDLVESFGYDSFWIFPDAKNDDGTVGQHALEIISVYYQDGDDIVPEPGEQFIEVRLGTRYYGEGYERGDYPLIRAVADWIEIRMPDVSLWYGGDSSGVEAVPFDRAERERLWVYFCFGGHRAYHGTFGSISGENRSPVVCGFCDHAMITTGGGGSISYWLCTGCGQKVVRDNSSGVVKIAERHEDFFKAHHRLFPDL